MASIRFDVDSAEIAATSRTIARLWGQYEWITARAMTTAAKDAKTAIQRQIFPMIQGGPTPWTKRGLMVSFARPDRLVSLVGFNYGDGSFEEQGFIPKGVGVPAGRYMEVNARGGDRRPKATERQLRRAGVIGGRDFIVPYPLPNKAVRGDRYGNIPGPTYLQVVSRLRGFAAAGATVNAPRGAGSRGRSAAKRGETDYFVRRDAAGQAEMIAKRVGPRPRGGTGKGSGRPGRPQTVGYPRGYAPMFTVLQGQAPNYERRFPVNDVALREYRRSFPLAWQAGFNVEARRRV
jgi:hypothetical protein